MSIQGLLQKGSEGCSKLEKAADFILSIPRFMWLGREIKIEFSEDNMRQIENKAKSISNFVSKEMKKYIDEESGVPLLMGVFYLLSSLVAAPILGLGFICKKIALLQDEKAKSYHKIVELTLKQCKLFSREKKLDSNRDNLERDIKWTSRQLQDPSLATKQNCLKAEKEQQEKRIKEIANQIKNINIKWKYCESKMEIEFNKIIQAV